MSLALEYPEWILLLDDYRPYLAAEARGIRVLCTPLLAATLHDEGAIGDSERDAILARLEAIRTVSPRLLERAWERLRD